LSKADDVPDLKCVLKIRDKTQCTWTMNDKNLNMPANATHLGIKRDTSSKFGVKLVVVIVQNMLKDF
jgi:hypothetical protein